MSVLIWMALGMAGGLLVGWVWGVRGRALAADATVATLGAVLGGFIASALLGLDIAGFDLTSSVLAGVGAAILLMLLHALPAAEVFD